jgi:tRNA(adenine34) deaminase
MLFAESHYRFMNRALQEAMDAFEDNEVPVGAVVVHNNRIIGRGYNRNEALQDPTAHAEIIALTAAANALGTNKLNDCDIYVTLEPCVMCTGALLLARIRTLYFGAFDPKYGACGSLYNIPQENKYNHKMEVFSGLEEDACKALLQHFFQQKRSNS